MIYGRVIGSELRDVPPECLPIWGQRWSGYRAPHGPSPFSTRIFSVDQMSEVGPTLTSPAQFEAAFTEEDEWDDARSESSQLYGSFSSSPLTNRIIATEPTPRPETPTPRFIHRSPNHLHSSPKVLHRSTGHPPPQDSTRFGTALLPRVESEQLGIQHHASEPLLCTSGFRHGTPGQCGHGSLENYTLWNMDRTSTSTQPRADLSQGSHIPSGQLQYTVPPYSTPEWRFSDAHTQSSAYPFQPNPLSHTGSGHFLQPFQADGQTSFIPTPPPSSSRFFTRALPQQNVGINSSWNPESSVAMIPGIAHSHNPVMAQWPLDLVPLDLSFPIPLQNSGSSLDPGPFYHLVSDHRRNSYPEGLLGTFAHTESCTLLPPNNDDQYTR